MSSLKTLLLGAACLGWAVAQNTDPQFPIKANNTLGVRYANDSTTAGPDKKAIQTPGEMWKAGDTINTPEIYADDWKPPSPINGSKLLLLMVDSDVPQDGHRSMLLHWLVPNLDWAALTAEGDKFVDGFTIPLPPDNTMPAPYKPPTPPPGDTAHAYTFVLFNQPPGFDITPFNDAIAARKNFDLEGFARDSGLGIEALGANFYRSRNEEEPTGSVSYPPARETGGSADQPLSSGKPESGGDGDGDGNGGDGEGGGDGDNGDDGQGGDDNSAGAEGSGAAEEKVFSAMMFGTVAFAVVVAAMML